MDNGLRVIEDLYQRLQIDDQWCLREERGFTWWAGDLRQRVWADEPFDDDGMEIVRLHARTDLVKGYSGTEHQAGGLAMFMHQCALSAFIRNPDDPSRIQLASSVFVNDSIVGWIGELFSWSVMLQNIEAHILIKGLPELLQVEADISAHPISGRREEMDPMSELITEIVAPEGASSSRFAGEEMAQLHEMSQRPPVVMANGDEGRLTVEWPFIGRTSLGDFVTEAQHPRLGNGLLCILALPIQTDDPIEEALSMNLRELTTLSRCHFLGGWCLAPTGRFSHVAFYPNAMYKPNLLTNIYVSQTLRAKWAAEVVYDDAWEEGGFQKAFENKMAMFERMAAPTASEPKRKVGLLGRLFGTRK